jgi:protein-disulfide isomerase
MNRPLLTSLIAACALAVGCPASTTGGSAGSSTVAKKGGGCDAASLAIDPNTVVGTLDGTNITFKDLGPEIAAAEGKALRQYCDGLDQARRAAFDNYVNDKLASAEAAKNQKERDAFLKEKVDAAVGTVTDEEVNAFYESHKRPGIPPLDQVKPQVINAIQNERREKAITTIIADLRKTAKVEEKLPDIRSPALNIDIPSHTASAGKKGAQVKLIEFADFECPYCSKAADNVKALKAKFGDRVEFAYRHFPLNFHPNARKAAEYAQCAGAQGKFWELHDKLYTSPGAIGEADIKGYAQGLGLDMEKLDKCMTAGDGAKQVDEDYKKGMEIGVEGTPSFFINGRPFAGNPTVEGLTEALEKELGKS